VLVPAPHSQPWPHKSRSSKMILAVAAPIIFWFIYYCVQRKKIFVAEVKVIFRQNEFIHRLDYMWKRKLKDDQEEVNLNIIKIF
jgi:hypothetical protein